MKRLIYCLDGTSNEYDDAHPTNVVMMHKSIIQLSDDGIDQVPYYHDGVGTKLGEKISGGAFGAGLLENIMDAYTHLCEHYEAGDEIYIFGFSRGAYTARSFAGLIGWCGILDSDKLSEIKNAKEYYKQRLLKEKHHVETFNQWRSDNCSSICANNGDYNFRKESFAKNVTIPEIIQIRYIGVWDTVRTLGKSDKDYRWHDDHLSSHVTYARHAIALDERRKKFNVTQWDNIDKLNASVGRSEKEDNPYQQLWFLGTHGSVGGGGAIRGLSDEAFQWIRRGAKNAGLQFIDSGDAEIFALKPNPLAWLYNSTGEANTFTKKAKSWFFKAVYWVTGLIDRNGPKSLDEIHKAVIIRYFAEPVDLPEKKKYRPASLNTIKGALSKTAPPFDEVAYRALVENSKKDNLADDEEKIVTISGERFLVHTVKKGESLSVIAKKQTGHGGDWRKIHEANKASIQDENLIYIGQRIFIPFDLISNGSNDK